jgi:hypothetical protein
LRCGAFGFVFSGKETHVVSFLVFSVLAWLALLVCCQAGFFVSLRVW